MKKLLVFIIFLVVVSCRPGFCSWSNGLYREETQPGVLICGGDRRHGYILEGEITSYAVDELSNLWNEWAYICWLCVTTFLAARVVQPLFQVACCPLRRFSFSLGECNWPAFCETWSFGDNGQPVIASVFIWSAKKQESGELVVPQPWAVQRLSSW